MASTIPKKETDRIAWLTNFKTALPEYAESLKLSSEQIEAVAAACDTLVFSIRLADAAKSFSKVCTAYRNEIAVSRKRTERTVPAFIAPEQPPTLAPANALVYLQRLVRHIKSKPEYDSSIGARLDILPKARRKISREDARPAGKLVALANSVVRVNWTKNGFVGVIVESERGAETTLTELSRDFSPPFIDTRPPLVANTPETRRYRLIYIVDDKPFGNYSPIYSISTTP